MKLKKISDESKVLAFGILALGLCIFSNPVETVNAEQTTNLVVNQTDYEVCQGETVEFYVQGKNEDRTFDIDKPTIIGEKVSGYEVVGQRKIKFTKTGTYRFYVSFEGAREEIIVNVTKPENTQKCKIVCADGVYTKDIVFKAESTEDYLIIESMNKEYNIPVEDGTVYLAKDKYITPLVITKSDGSVIEADERWITCNSNEISILATQEEVGEYFD